MGVLGIEDPLKAGVPEAIAALRSQGIGHIIMLTGDNERTAARIAAEAGITEYRADLLPRGQACLRGGARGSRATRRHGG